MSTFGKVCRWGLASVAGGAMVGSLLFGAGPAAAANLIFHVAQENGQFTIGPGAYPGEGISYRALVRFGDYWIPGVCPSGAVCLGDLGNWSYRVVGPVL
jgi:hypothetical protein